MDNIRNIPVGQSEIPRRLTAKFMAASALICQLARCTGALDGSTPVRITKKTRYRDSGFLVKLFESPAKAELSFVLNEEELVGRANFSHVGQAGHAGQLNNSICADIALYEYVGVAQVFEDDCFAQAVSC